MKQLSSHIILVSITAVLCSSCLSDKFKKDKPEPITAENAKPIRIPKTTEQPESLTQKASGIASKLMPWKKKHNQEQPVVTKSEWKFNSPEPITRNPEDKPQYLSANELAKKYKVSADENRELLHKIEEARTRRSTTDMMFLQEVAESEHNLLSPVATEALGQFGTAASERILVQLFESQSTPVKAPALAALILSHSSYAKGPCMAELRRENPSALYVLALHGVYKFGWAEAIPLISNRLKDSPPHLQLEMAQALLPWNEPKAEIVLKTFSLTNDPQLAVPSMRALAARGKGAIPLYKNLYSDSDPIRITALSLLHRDEELRNAIKTLPQHEVDKARQWYKILTYAVWGEGDCPAEATTMASSGTVLERKVAIQCLQRNPQSQSLTGLIDAMLLLEPTDRHELYRIIEQKKNALHLNPLPDMYANLDQWQQWWFRQHYVLAIQSNQALLLLPDKTEQRITKGFCLQWNALITEIHVGEGKSGTRGGYVELQTRMNVIRLQALPQGLRQY